MANITDKIRQQFDRLPYPNHPLEAMPSRREFYRHDIATPFYLKYQKVVAPSEKVILDAGCGSGYKALVLAKANPGAKIVGIDLSPESVKLARTRLQDRGIENAEFHALSIEDLPQLGMKFDYINCDEVLYLLPDPIAGLQAMQSVLNPDGIIRANLHSRFQRERYFRAQELCRSLGLMEASPGDLEIELLEETMAALKDDVSLKKNSWVSIKGNEEKILANYMLQGDRGFTINDLFAMLERSQLEFIAMVNWRQWEITQLFQNPDDLPAFVAMGLSEATPEEQLHLFELLHPVHRLLDFWCGHPRTDGEFLAVDEWEDEQWQNAIAYLHPQLQTAEVRTGLEKSAAHFEVFPLGDRFPIPGVPQVLADSALSACLLPLWEKPHAIVDLARRWHQLRPLHPVTLQPISLAESVTAVRRLLTTAFDFGYVLLETQ